MKNIAIICDVMKSDFMEIAEKKSLNNMDFIFMEQQLHNTPDLMRKKLQEEIDKIDSGREYGRIILGYGLCSNGVMNLVSKNHEIVIPKVDDCISLFLGSKERYIEEFRKDPATYYLCKGWIEFGGDPYRGYLLWTGRENLIPASWIRGRERYGERRYDEATARFLVADMLKHYKKIVLINNDDIDDIHRQYLDGMIKFLNELLERQFELEEVQGSLKFLEKLAVCQTDERNFLSYGPGETIKQEHFFK